VLTAVLNPSTAAEKPGEIKGATLDPAPDNLAATWAKANLVLPAALAGGQRWQGLPSAAPEIAGKAPLVILLHGSSGIAPAVKEFHTILDRADVREAVSAFLRNVLRP
jgi:hypothetical protein